MNELIAAWTRAGNAVAAYYEKEAGAEAPAGRLSEDIPKAARTRKPKEEKAPDAPAAPAQPAVPPTPPAAAELTDKESYDEMCRLAIAYIAADKPGTEERRALAMKHVEATYRVSALSGVPHGPQRLQLIEWFKGNLPKVAASAPAPAGFGV